jgi:hypothetical protein
MNKTVMIMLLALLARDARAQATLQTPPTTGEQWNVYELTVQDGAIYTNPFWDVTLQGDFVGPNSETITVHGFYYEGTLWKVRLAPSAVGTWSYRVLYSRTAGVDSFKGTFQCTAPSAGNRGFIQVNPSYPHKFKQSDNTPFIPRGTAGHTPAVLSAFLGISPSAQQVPAMWDSLASYDINTFRLMLFHQSAFEVPISWNTGETMANFFAQSGGLDRYNTFVGKVMDRWFEQAQAHGIAIYPCMLVGFDITAYPFVTSAWSTANGGPYATHDAMYQQTSGTGFELEKKYFTYLVNRYSAYRNLVLWEYNNEYGYIATLPWLAAMDSVVRANDPYGRGRTVSFWDSRWSNQTSVYAQNTVTVTDDHFYSFIYGATEFNGDSAANAQARYRWTTYQKPVMFGEFGSGEGNATESWLTFQRVAYWGALTGGGTPLYWLSGGNDASGWSYNQRTIRFLGGIDRALRRIRDFNTMQPSANVSLLSPGTVRVLSLANTEQALVYAQNYTSHGATTNGIVVGVTFPGAGSVPFSGVWVNATTGDSIGVATGQTTNGLATVNVPQFTTDAALVLTLNTSTGVAGEEQIPREFRMSQNYPNPFNPGTTIRFELPYRSHVVLTVFNALGQEVATLVRGEKSAGRHEAHFDGSRLSSGVYFYRLQAGAYVETRKLLLIW